MINIRWSEQMVFIYTHIHVHIFVRIIIKEVAMISKWNWSDTGGICWTTTEAEVT